MFILGAHHIILNSNTPTYTVVEIAQNNSGGLPYDSDFPTSSYYHHNIG